jgi:hypothetical protein
MLDPPFDPGVKETIAWALPAEADAPVGAEGVVNGVEETMLDAVEVPMIFCAITSKSYDCPFVKEVAVAFVAGGVVVAKRLKVDDPVVRS